MKARIHVNQHNIRHNARSDDRKDVLTVKTYKENRYCSEVVINGPSKVVYSPVKPLSCGARVWIECDAEDIELITLSDKEDTNQLSLFDFVG